MIVVSSCSSLQPIHWSHVLSWEWRYSWSSADRRCSNYIWVINNFIANSGVTYIRRLTVDHETATEYPTFLDDIFTLSRLNETLVYFFFNWNFIQFCLQKSAVVQLIAWCSTGDKPLSAPLMVCILTHICATRSQRFNWKFSVIRI